MASDKEKRFRVHVVKELFETELAYTEQLQFTVTHILEKSREKGVHDNSFTQEIIQVLFCNIEEILLFHRQLTADLKTCLGSKGATFETQIAQCYVNQRTNFSPLYQKYGENNEQAQKLLYELYDQPAFKAFFVACMLLGGKSDEDISGLVFKPIQRVCKYPLLFRELSKYTPEGHPDYEATQEAQGMMRVVCSVINEAKRRVEKLENIADWQAMVEGWEGTNVTDTCNELVKEGPLIKISAGNTQERMFYLFDNLLVYCKRTTQLLAGSKSRNKGLLFRGRVPVSSLDIEDIVDGTADFYTKGIAVNNSWKVHNVAKNKWFVLVAKSADEKQQWMEAIRREKEKKKRQAAGIAQDNRALALDKGEKIYYNMRRDKVMKDHKFRMRTYTNSFTGLELVKWLTEKNEVADGDEATLLSQALLENGVLHHVTDRHQFKNDRDLLYRFRFDDGTFRNKLNSSDLTARGIRIYCRLHGLFDPLIREQKVGLRNMKCVINSQKMIDWWQAEKDIKNRQDGVALGQEFLAVGFLRHSTDEQNFKDGNVLYRFTSDDGLEDPKEKSRKLSTIPTKADFNMTSVSFCRVITLPFTELDHGYGVELEGLYPPTIKSVSPSAEVCGAVVGQTVVAINGQVVSWQNLSELLKELSPQDSQPHSLVLLISRGGSSEYTTLAPSSGGLGFHIKGNSPVIIHRVDKGSSAAKAGIIPGCCILKVGDEDVLRSSHDSVVAAVKSSLQKTKEKQGKSSVHLKLSFPFLEQLACFKYESNDASVVEVFEQTIESPYTFSLPSQLLQLYAKEADHVTSLMSQSGITHGKVEAYLKHLETLSAHYLKMSSLLDNPRWPSYKLHGIANATFLEACPTNLHTSIIDVVTCATSTPPPTPTMGTDAVSQSPDEEPPSPPQTTSYLITTVAIPSVGGKSLTSRKSDCDALNDVHFRRQLLQTLITRVGEMDKDISSIAGMISEIMGVSSPSPSSSGGVNFSELSLSTSLSNSLHDDLTPNVTPTTSPTLTSRHRIISISNPEPVLKLVVEGLLQKSSSLLKSLEDRLMLSVLQESDGILVQTSTDLIDQFRERLGKLSQEVRSCAKRPGEPLNQSIHFLIDATHKYIQELSVRIWISMALCHNSDLQQTSDLVTFQLLTAVVTSFAQHLIKASKGQLNPGVEYEEVNQEASTQWLQMVAMKGVLVHLQSTMIATEESELTNLKDLHFIQEQLSRVILHVKKASADDPHCLPYTELPPVTADGNRDSVHITFHLSSKVADKLPESILSETGIKIVPVLFNKGFIDIAEGSEVYGEERSLNLQSFKSLKNYYLALRAFRLDKSNLPSDSDAKLVAIHKISQPLNAMDILMRQVEVAIREPTRPGVGLLTISAELATRIGALRINVCDSGVFRSGMASSLEHVMTLGRCHGLGFKNFRSSLNKMRKHGSFPYIVRKNNADISKCLPKQPPKLYRLPPDTSNDV